ncbi:hypothetical protein QQS21_010245 [Conoideocrella luteorostrata]|uniref:Uncharacterized protein n=1 Tax=Conoideocrella luteorostrata TaxID=1105319 RepID=A0AAJ0CFM3_9HYPO|nr:hypothetical protein QQS21_010245 [Conoideocrella luteorostrata]
MESPEDPNREIQRLRRENADLVARLDRATATIMRIQGSSNYITDGEIEKKFEKLYTAIQTWVEDVEKDFMLTGRKFQHDFYKVIEDLDVDERLLDAGLRHDEASSDEQHEEVKRLVWLAGNDSCLHVFLNRTIWQRLVGKVFDAHYSFGMPQEARGGFDYMMRALSDEDEDNGKYITICDKTTTGKFNTAIAADSIMRSNRWRSESVSKLSATKFFEHIKESRIQSILLSLKKELADSPISLEEKTSLPRRLKALETTVIRPAVELKQAMACSPFEYRIEEPTWTHREAMLENTLSLQWTLKDVVKWRKPDNAEDFGGIFCCLFPAVIKIAVEKELDLALVRPFVLVYNKEALQQIQDLRPMISRRNSSRLDQDPPYNPSPLSSRSSTAKSREEWPHDRGQTSKNGVFGKLIGALSGVSPDYRRQNDAATRPPRESQTERKGHRRDQAKRKGKGQTSRHQELERSPAASSQQRQNKPKMNPDETHKNYHESETDTAVNRPIDTARTKPREIVHAPQTARTSEESRKLGTASKDLDYPTSYTATSDNTDHIIVEEETQHCSGGSEVRVGGPLRSVGVDPKTVIGRSRSHQGSTSHQDSYSR